MSAFTVEDDSKKHEHVMACVSPSPYNVKVIEEAGRMAKAYGAVFTALYVSDIPTEKLTGIARGRLEENLRLAEALGAKIVSIDGGDVAYQIAEYARVSGVTKLVMGHDIAGKQTGLLRHSLSEKILQSVLTADIYIIPEAVSVNEYRIGKRYFYTGIVPFIGEIVKTLLVVAAATGIGFLFDWLHFTEANIITIYIMSALITALVTHSYICCIIASFSGALFFFYFFSQAPPGTNLFSSGYAVTFTIILIASLIGGRIAVKLSEQAQQSASGAFRTRILFDTNRLLTSAENYPDIMSVLASQISKLLDREMLVFPVEDGALGEATVIPAQENNEPELERDMEKTVRIAGWVVTNNMRAGAGTDFFRESPYMFLSVTTGEESYGVVAVYTGTVSIDPFEHSVLLSIMGECAMAIENLRNREEKERAARKAENEQERANILRSISHDLRTPLTSISGNAANLMSDGGSLDDETKRHMYADIYDDAAWLTGLIENLLSVTQLDNSAIKLNRTAELVEDVVREALKHCSRDIGKHVLEVQMPDEPVIAMMDTHLISQVITNLVNNAVKYTPEGSMIRVSARDDGSYVFISVADDGGGIADEDKEKVFEMFYSGNNKLKDSSRSLGLGLALCRTIVRAHGGDIILEDNKPAGSIFTFSLPTYEEKIHE